MWTLSWHLLPHFAASSSREVLSTLFLCFLVCQRGWQCFLVVKREGVALHVK